MSLLEAAQHQYRKRIWPPRITTLLRSIPVPDIDTCCFRYHLVGPIQLYATPVEEFCRALNGHRSSICDCSSAPYLTRLEAKVDHTVFALVARLSCMCKPLTWNLGEPLNPGLSARTCLSAVANRALAIRFTLATHLQAGDD